MSMLALGFWHAKAVCKAARRLGALAAAGTLTALLCFVNGEWNIEMAAVFFVLSAMEMLAISAMLSRNAKLHKERNLGTQLVDYLYRAVYGKKKSGSFALAMLNAQRNVAHKELGGKIAKELKMRFMSSAPDGEPEAGILHGCSTRQGAESRVAAYMLAEKSRRSRIDETAQRYATFGMFVSTILPSFMIFAFIGDYVLAQSAAGLLFLSVGLLSAVPIIYSLGSTLMWRRLLG